MAKIISITNQKGGVGKTTTTGAVAAGFKLKGYKVLCVDLDPQSNLSFSASAETEECPTIYEILKGEALAYMGVSKFPARIRCANLAWHAAKEGVLKEKEENNG